MAQYRLALNLDLKKIRTFVNPIDWVTKDGQEVSLNGRSHPHFGVKKGQEGHYLIGFALQRMNLSRIPDGSKIVVSAKFNRSVGYSELTSHSTNVITLVLSTYMSKVYLNTAYFGYAMPSVMNSGREKTDRRAS